MQSALRAGFERIADLIQTDSNEDDVERLFQPIYEALGYTEPGHDIRGKRRGESGAPDVALLNSDRSFQVIVELKAPAEVLSRHRKQLFGYVTELKAPWGVLSNGIRLELYRREGMSVIPVDNFDIAELANNPAKLTALSKQHFDLEDFSIVEARIASARGDPLSLQKLDSFSSRVFLETFDLAELSPFGRLVGATMRLFTAIEEKSSFQAGSFSFWKKFFARNLSMDDVPDGWRPFLIPPTTANLSKFMFVLETAYALVARLILAKAIQDKDPRGVLAKEPLSSVLLNYLRTRKNQRTGRVDFSCYPEAIAEVFSSYSKSLFIGVFAEDIFDWWKDFSLATAEAQRDFGQHLSELLFALVGFDFTRLEGDLLGELYQSYFDPDTRKALGEFYTPPELVDLILDQVGYVGEGRLLDPACGSGTFLVQALRRYLRRNRSKNPVSVLRGLTEGFALVGFDINPFAVMMAEVNLAAHLIPLYAAAAERDPKILLRRLPVVRTDSLRQEPREGERISTGMQIGLDFGDETIRVRIDLPVGAGDDPLQVALTFPRLEAALNQGTVRNEREWLITLQALFEAVDVGRRIGDPASGPFDLRPYLFSALSRTFPDPGPVVDRLIVYADEVWKLLGYLKKEHGDGRFLKTLEDLVLGLVLKHDLSYDFVVGNPPYVRIQNLPERQRSYWASLYSWAEGNYDIYVPFIERPLGTDRPWLSEGGHLAYVVSNSFLVTGAGEKLRNTLPSVSRIDAITDFKAVRFLDGNLFRGAMTYTCILVATRTPSPEVYDFPVIRFHPRNAGLSRSEALKTVGEAFRAIKAIDLGQRVQARIEVLAEGTSFADAFWETSGCLLSQGWYLMPSTERSVFEKLARVGEQVDPALKLTTTRDNTRKLINYTGTDSAGFAGVQTSLDDVMLLQLVERDEKKRRLLVRPKGSEDVYWIEEDALRPFLFGRDVWRWNIAYENWYVVFPYFKYEQTYFLLPTKAYWKFEVVSRRGHRHERRRVFAEWPAESPFLDERYPLLFKYLQDNERELRRREQGRFMRKKSEEWRWYDLGYPRSLEAAHKPKIVAQLLARSAQFAFDPKGQFLFQAGGKGGGVYGIMLKDNVEPEAVLALLNSKTVDFYLRHITQFYNPAGSCSYADAFLKYLPIAALTSSGRRSLKKSSVKLSELASYYERLLLQIRNFPQSATDQLEEAGAACPTEQVSNLAEISNLPSIIRSDAMAVQALLDGRVSVAFGRGTIWADKDLGDLIQRAVSNRQHINRADFLELAFPARAKDRPRYLKIAEAWEHELHDTGSTIARMEEEQNTTILGAYGLSSSEVGIIDKFLSRF